MFSSPLSLVDNMEKRALSNPSRGSNTVSIVATSAIINFIKNHQFIDRIVGEHFYDSSVEEKCNVNDLLGIVDNILSSVIPLVNKESGNKKVPTDAPQTNISSNISHLINWICCQMTCEAARSKNVETRLLQIFWKVSSYRWTTQVLLVLAAFALQYGDFWFISEAPSDGRNALSTCLLKGLSSLKKKLISNENKMAAMIPLNKVINDLLELTTHLVRLSNLVIQNRGKHVPELATAFRTIPRWSCETIIAILTAGNYFARLIDDDKLAESELEILALSVSDTKSDVLRVVKSCERKIGQMEEYQKYVKKVEAPVDIVDFLISLLTAKDSSQDPIVTGPNDTPVKLELFRKKSVLLIISDQNISPDDIETLRIIHDDETRFRISPKEDDPKAFSIQIQTEKETLYELVWIPIVDARPENLEPLPKFNSLMPWAYRVDPQKMNELAATYIKEEWRFKRETMVVVFDSLGLVENTDAMPMLRIWGTHAFPYTGIESKHPWTEPCNWVQLVLKRVVQQGILDAIKDECILFWGAPAAAEAGADVSSGILNHRAIQIEDMKLFRILLRSCLICRLQALQILKFESSPLLDRIVYEMTEAYGACQKDGVAILTKGPELQVQHVGLFSDLKLVMDQVAKDGGTALAEDFEKKYKDAQGQSICLHVCVPHYTSLGDFTALIVADS
ncbi:hypothetical protein NL676_021880 [Syzygium grande]|nr:hypothetical protein NL676_021880 [Syzygium grande]